MVRQAHPRSAPPAGEHPAERARADRARQRSPCASRAELWRELEAARATATVRVHLAGCAALYRALRWTGATDAHPFGDVKIAKPDERRADERREAFTEPEVARLLSVASPVDAALVLLGARGGLRLAEALALRWQDVHLDHDAPRVTVRNGKGGRTRAVELVPELVDALCALRREGLDPEYVLPYRSQTRARQRLRRLQERAHVAIRCGRAAHSLRHTAGTAVYAANGNLVAVQEWLGHADVSTSRGYVHRAQRAKLRDIARSLPRLSPA